MKEKLLHLTKTVLRNALYGFLIQCCFLTTLLASDSKAPVKSIEETFVRLEKKEIEIIELFGTLEKRTEFRFVYPDDLPLSQKSISLEGKRSSVYQILAEIARNHQFKFKQVNNSIYVGKSDEPEASTRIPIEIEYIQISGKLTDQNGMAIPGATVLVEDTTTGTATDIEGGFSLDAPERDYLWPIPRIELETNTALTQNPEY